MQAEVLYRIYLGIHHFLNILGYALIAYALMSWFVRPDSRLYRVTARFCEPLVTPFRPLGRRLIRAGLRLDLSVWFALIALRIADTVIYRIIISIIY